MTEEDRGRLTSVSPPDSARAEAEITLLQAQVRKLALETDHASRRHENECLRLEAEQLRSIAETEEIRRRLAERWYSPGLLLRYSVAGVVAGILLTVWGIGVLQPLVLQRVEKMDHENTLGQLKNEIERNKIELATHAIAADKIRIEAENTRILGDLQGLKEQFAALDAQHKDLSTRFAAQASALDQEKERYQRLASDTTRSQEERDEYLSRIRELEEQSRRLEQDLSAATQARAEGETRSRTIDERLVAQRIRAIPVAAQHAWENAVESVLLEEYDANRSGQIDESGEMNAIPCSVLWAVNNVGMNAPWNNDLLVASGFKKDMVWNATRYGFAESIRSLGEGRIRGCGIPEWPEIAEPPFGD